MLKQVCLIFCLLSAALAKAQHLPLETYTPANGMVDARVSKMYQDSRGRLYFLTREGFSIFDGQHFDNYGNNSNYGTGIISDIAEYENGTVKVFSYDGDIYTINQNHIETDTSKRDKLKELSKIFSISTTEKLIITNYYFIRQSGNTIWPLSTGTIKPAFIENSILYRQYLVIVQTDENKNQQLFLYNYNTQLIEDSVKITSPVTFLSNTSNKIMLATVAGSWFQLDSVLLQHGKLRLLPFDNHTLIPENFAPFKIQKGNGDNSIWFINAEKGYCKVNLLTNAKEFFDVSNGISNTASWVFEDEEKNYWFGSTARGVQKLQQASLFKLDKIDGYNPGYVNAINTSPTKESFINASNGIFLADKKIAPSYKDNNSFIFWQDEYWQFKDYKTLTGSKGHVYDLSKLIAGYTPEDFLFSHSSIDSKGRLLIAGRVFIFISNNYQFHFLRPDYFCDNIVETTNNEYWCFLRNNEVIKLKWENDTLKKIYSKSFTNLAPRYTIQWDSSTFFTGTRLGGIKIFRWIKNDLQQTGTINKTNGLSNNFINVLLKIDAHRLLAGTGTGLDEITVAEKDTVIENISQRNTIYVPFTHLVQQYDTTILCRTMDGQLFKLTTSNSTTGNFIPAAFFKTILVNNERVDEAVQKEFNYGQNNFSFNVSTPSFFDNKKILFNFLLQCNGQQWEQNSNSAEMEIKNLFPGNYTLTVNIQYPGKIYPNKQLTYNFTITPPFWKRWWFIILAMLLSAALITYMMQLFYRRRLQKQLIVMEKQQAVEKERTRIATDMHDDFGANLSRIKFISEKVQLLHQQDDNLKTDLVKISAYSDEMAEKMNEIVWALNQRYDTIEDLISFSRAYAADYLQDKDITLRFNATINTNKKIQGEVRRNIFMVIKEALHNVTKHAGAKTVTIEFKEEQRQLKVYISDDGKGFDTANIRPFANGLENMKKRMESIDGQIEIFKDNGTNIIMQIPL
jgi:signal transduction histidine kinase